MLNQLSFNCSETYVDARGVMCIDVTINGKVIKFEAFGFNPVNGWYQWKEVKDAK